MMELLAARLYRRRTFAPRAGPPVDELNDVLFSIRAIDSTEWIIETRSDAVDLRALERCGIGSSVKVDLFDQSGEFARVALVAVSGDWYLLRAITSYGADGN